jgi:ABC-type multidrug transport system fused ATPase/permease subunit
VNVRRWFDVHGESFALVGIVGVFFVFCFLRFHGFFVFQVGKNTCSVLGTLVQSLASVFAIVFSISLVAVQFCSEQLSYRLMRLYVWNLNFVVPFVMNALALLFNLFLLSYICYYGLMDFGLLLGFMAVVSLIPFFVYTFRFMVPVHVVGVLLDRVKTNPMLLSENFAERILYRENFQPVEDIISSCVRKGDYAMAQDSIERVREKMYAVLNVVKKRIGKESESSSIRLIVS